MKFTIESEYDEDKHFKAYIERRLKQMSPENRKIAEEYIKLRMNVDNRKWGTINNDTLVMLQLSKLFGDKTFYESTEDDIRKFVEERKDKKNKGKLTTKTYNCTMVTVKNFYRFLRFPDDCKNGIESKYKENIVYPKEVEWIKLFKIDNVLKTKHVLEREHIDKMKGACDNERDTTLIEYNFEVGARGDEVSRTLIKDIIKRENKDGDKQWLVMCPNKKKKSEEGRRRVNIRVCIPQLAAYLNNHPYKDYPEAPLFCSKDPRIYTAILQKKSEGTLTKDDFKHLRLTESSINRIVKNAGVRAKIPFPVTIHLFRHSAATSCSRRNLNESYMRLRFGWSRDSKMPSLYSHIVNGDNQELYDKSLGIEPKEKEEMKPLGKICPNCNEINPLDYVCCSKCNMVLDYKELERMKNEKEEKEKERIKRIMDEIKEEENINK